MSNDIIHELEMDLAREKEKIFFQKYKYIIVSIIGIFLTAVVGYQFFQNQKAKQYQAAADDYYTFKNFYNNIEALTDVNNNAPVLNSDTLKNLPDYAAMSALIRFNSARKNDASDKELLKITTDYLNLKGEKPQTIHDSMLRLFHLSLRIDHTDFKTLEPEFVDYLKHPFAFKYLGYEMLFLLAIDAKDADKAKHYLASLGDIVPAEAVHKLKIYQTHPLVAVNKPVHHQSKK